MTNILQSTDQTAGLTSFLALSHFPVVPSSLSKKASSSALIYLQEEKLLAPSSCQIKVYRNVTTPHIKRVDRHPARLAMIGVIKSAASAPRGPPTSVTAVAIAFSDGGTQLLKSTRFVGYDGPSRIPMKKIAYHRESISLRIPKTSIPLDTPSKASPMTGFPPNRSEAAPPRTCV